MPQWNVNLSFKQGERLTDLQKWVGYQILILNSNNFQKKLLIAHNFKTIKKKEWKSGLGHSLKLVGL